jgi:hypothetical protein
MLVRWWPCVFVVALLLFAQGCGYERSAVFASPSGLAVIEVLKPRRPNSRLAIVLATKSSKREIYRTSGETFFSFADVYWSPDEAVVGVVITGTNLFTLAFDVHSGKIIPFDSVRPQIAAAIRKHYKLPPDIDPIRWTWSGEAQNQFIETEIAPK